jgi:two-component system, NtrC family, response regulator AtoC
MGQILVVDDEEGLREYLAEALEQDGHEVVQAEDGIAALERIAERNVQVVLTDLKMPRLDGHALIKRLRAEHPELEIIVLTAHGTVGGAVEAMKLGVFDFLGKPIGSPAELRMLVARALERHRLRAQSEAIQKDEPRLELGAPAMTPIVHALRKVATTSATVLLVGESGTGKEVAAQAIHRWSGREGPFVAVNCAALSEQLLESELFGHEKGAFTGAVAKRRGKIELAEGGTFFLDEVGELRADLQAKLLRVLQERAFERVGGNQLVKTDVRWIAATNRDLEAMMQAGSFREDLYHRLAVFPIRLPPLRERREDIAPLAQILLARIGASLGRSDLALTDDALQALARAPWRGNVRELANVLERAAILADGRVIDRDALPLAPTSSTNTATTLADLERAAIEASLARHHGNRKKVAEELDIPIRTLFDRIKRYALD